MTKYRKLSIVKGMQAMLTLLDAAKKATISAKYAEKYLWSLPINVFSLYNEFVVQGHFPL